MTVSTELPTPAAAKAVFDWRLATILIIAWTLRFGAAQLWPNIQWADEIYQVLEPAHRTVFGYGLASWEWDAGMRSPVLPGFFAGLLEIAKWLDLGPRVYLPAIEAVLSAMSLSVVWVAYRLGAASERGTDPLFGAAVAAAPAALWIDLVLFAPHALADPIAAYIMAPGLYLLQTGTAARGMRRDPAAGALLGLATALRPAFGPPLLLGVILVVGRSRGRWLGLIASAAVVLVAYGTCDMLQGQWPFESTARFVAFNLFGTGSGNFGLEGWGYYLSMIVSLWGGALPFLLLLILFGARGNALWLVVAAGLMVEYSILPHKEYRFLVPAMVCLVPPLGIGAARAAALAARWALPNRKASIIRIAWLVIASCSAALARQPLYAERWTSGDAALGAFQALREDPSVCGVGLLKGVPVTFMPGYVWIHRDLPMYFDVVDSSVIAGRASDLLSAEPRTDLPQGYAFQGCWRGSPIGRDSPTRICRYHRPGSCATAR